MTSSLETQLVAAIITSLLAIIPVGTAVVINWLNIRRIQTQVNEKPSHDEVSQAIESSLTNAIQNGSKLERRTPQ